jgi:hypothetical protein
MQTNVENDYKELPNELKDKYFENGSKDFESLSNGLQMLSIIERESEIKKESEKESKKESKNFTPPFLPEVKIYFIENGYSEESAIKAFKYYNEANWVDSNGNKVRNWKQKMQGVWFKEENKIKEEKKRGLVR